MPLPVKPKIGIVGTFQAGKSTLINCLLQEQRAVCGNGEVTTRKLFRYTYGPLARIVPHASPGSPAGKERSFEELPKISQDPKVGMVDILLPNPRLKEIELLDAPGFGANDDDTSAAEMCIKQMDCGIWLIGDDRGELGDEDWKIADRLRVEEKPFVVIFNSHATSDAEWNPQSEDNLALRDNIKEQLNRGFSGLWAIGRDSCPDILGLNAAWVWYCCAQKKHLQISHPWVRSIPHDDIEKMENDSNFSILTDFLDPQSAKFGGLFWRLRLDREQNRFREELKKNILSIGDSLCQKKKFQLPSR